MQITRVALTTEDPDAAGGFYADVLGLPVRRGEDGVHVHAGSSALVLLPGPAGPGVHHLAFTVTAAGFAGAAAAVGERVGLLEAGGRVEFEGPAHWNSRSLYFPGPGGAVLELIVRPDLPDAELTGAAPGSAVACLSEVGVPAPDVSALLQELAATCALDPFGAPSESFAPVGDQHGLLICVSPQRSWAPQHARRAHGGPLHVTMTTPAGTAQLSVGADLTRRITR